MLTATESCCLKALFHSALFAVPLKSGCRSPLVVLGSTIRRLQTAPQLHICWLLPAAGTQPSSGFAVPSKPPAAENDAASLRRHLADDWLASLSRAAAALATLTELLRMAQ